MRSKLTAVAASAAMVASAAAATGPALAKPHDEAKKPFVVLMTEAPAVAYQGGTDGLRRTAPAKGAKIDPKAAKVRTYVDHLTDTHAAVLARAGVRAKPLNTFTYAANGFSALMTPGEAERLRLQKGVMSVQRDVLRQAQTDTSGTFLGLNGAGEAWTTGLTGEGVVVGIIDTGIWPEHPSFADDGTFPAPTDVPADLPCDFGDTEHNAADLPFDCQNKLIGARDMRTTYKKLVGPEVYDSARDYNGHGTHTASTAAGNSGVHAEIFGIDRGTVSGIAPRAHVIAYSALGELGGYASDLAKAIDQAVADGVDVINYSIGSSTPSLAGADEIAFLYAAGAGVHVATSNGNDGPGASTTGSPASVPWVTAVGASTHARTFESTAALGNGATYTGASLTEGVSSRPLVDAADLGNPLCKSEVTFEPSPTDQVVLCARGDNARVDKSKAVYEQGGAGMILFNQNDGQALLTDNHFLPSVHVTYSDGMAIRDYIKSTGPGHSPPGSRRSARKPPRAPATASLTEGEAAPRQGSVMADFSSRGPIGAPGSADIIRPDVTAPGVNVLAGNTPTPDAGRPGQLFQAISGTSMSSPHVAGLMALLEQAHPGWSPAAAKSALMTTARQDVTKEDGTTPADPFDMGAGHVQPGKVADAGSMFDPGIVYHAGFNDYLAFLCAATDGVVKPATCNALAGAGYSTTDAAQLNLPSIGDASVPGTTVIKRRVTNVSGRHLTMTPSWEAPAGYTVSVSPASLSLTPGQTKPVEVTISNQSAPVGEWAFGSLTWSGQGFTARSPIAVKGSSIGAPAEVSFMGPDGAGSVGVSFGYTGDYSVDAHGLASEVLTSGTVGQDPDQNFATSDVGNGATVHDINLRRVKFYRLTMSQADVTGPGKADADLDIFVHDSAGNEVASSTSAGTDEVIEIADPAPGRYRVYIHGWKTGGKVVGYTFHSWAVSSTPDAGTLSVTGAPGSAVMGTTGTVDFAWTGVPVGGTSLGLLSHRDATGEIATTLVNVTG